VAEWLVQRLLIDMTPTISLLELIWTALALAAWTRYSHRAWHALRGRWRARRAGGRLGVQAHAKIRCQRFLFLALIAECLTLVGLGAMLQPPSRAANTGDPVALIAPLLLLAVVGLLVLKGEIIERDERALEWLYRQELEVAQQQDYLPEVTGYRFHGHS
jgi:hypothetical protein